eukprot:m.55639 g.55639  ORF g.55639 m.55639 type:complete len:344 (+) comp13328_c0_seq1:33-1064(+)
MNCKHSVLCTNGKDSGVEDERKKNYVHRNGRAILQGLFLLIPSQLPALCDDNLLARLATVTSAGLHAAHNAHAVGHRSKHHVLVVQPLCLGSADEKLRAVGVASGVGHGESARAHVPQLKVLVRKGAAIDGLAARAVVGCKVTALAHEARNNSVEARALEAKAALARAELPEVFCCARRHVRAQLHDYAALRSAANADVKVHARILRPRPLHGRLCLCAVLCLAALGGRLCACSRCCRRLARCEGSQGCRVALGVKLLAHGVGQVRSRHHHVVAARGLEAVLFHPVLILPDGFARVALQTGGARQVDLERAAKELGLVHVVNGRGGIRRSLKLYKGKSLVAGL